MQVRRAAFIVFTALLISVFLFANGTKARMSLPFERTLISFHKPMTRSDVHDFLQAHELMPTAVYMVSTGLVGAHRTYEVKNPREFLQDAQTQTIQAMQKGLEGNILPLKTFIEQHSEEDVLADKALQQEMRSLLNIRFQIQATLQAAKDEMPTIYAIEVTGGDLSELRSDERIAEVESYNLITARLFGERPNISTTYQQEFLAPELEKMTPHEMYRYMESLVTEHK